MTETADYKKGSPKYDPAEKYNWKLMTVPDLAHYHIMIVDRMSELGMAGVPQRVQNFANDSEAGARACKTIDQRVKEFLAGVDKKDESAAPEREAAAPKEGAGKGPGRKKSAPAKTAKRSAAPERDTASESTEGETEMARSKSTKGRKVGAGKKAKATARVRTAFDPTAKIHVQPAGKENPRRAGTGPYKRYQKILENAGKTFAHYIEKGGRADTLKRAVSEKLVKVA